MAIGARPRVALILGAVGFAFFYWLFPMFVHGVVENAKSQMNNPMYAQWLDQLMERRFVHASELAAWAILLVCGGIATWKALTRRSVTDAQGRDAGWLARTLARLLD
ncbi:hypothetical protein [Roseateles sp. MS654]|uniref:hypothetical protein n=1 Tax=Roseateles sp. MS654 TaxID=3412685 RepID=UPI003C2DC53F